MKPNEPHSFTPRNPDTAEGRTTCVCGLDANAHLLSGLVENLKQFAPKRFCSEDGCPNKAHSKGLCRTHLGREVVMSSAVSPDLAAQVDRARGPSLSRSAWIRGAILRALTVEVPPEKDDPATPDPIHFP